MKDVRVATSAALNALSNLSNTESITTFSASMSTGAGLGACWQAI
jgi:hypothetical protein